MTSSRDHLRIALVSPHLPPTHLGGVEVYTQYLMRAFAAEGHVVESAAVERLATSRQDGCDAVSEDADGGRVHRLTVTLAASRSFPMLTDHGPVQAWFESRWTVLRPHVVHVQSGYLLGAPALAAASRLGVPAVLTLHDYWFACPRVTLRHPHGAICSGAERPEKCAWCLSADKRRYLVLDRVLGGRLTTAKDRSMVWTAAVGGPTTEIVARQRLLRDLLASATLVMAPTRFVAARVAEGTGYSLDRIRLSRYGMPPLAVTPTPRGSTVRLAFIGQLAPHKGVHVAIDAVRALPGHDVSLAIHGPLAPYPEYVETLRAKANGDSRIEFHGPYRREQLPSIFAQSDVVVVPSLWHEVAAIVIQEAQMAGLPVVASTLGGSPELVTDGVDGLLFDVAQPGDLARQLARLVDEAGLLERLRAALRPPRTLADEVNALLTTYREVALPS